MNEKELATNPSKYDEDQVMKTLVLGALLLATAATPAMADRYRHGGYNGHGGYGGHYSGGYGRYHGGGYRGYYGRPGYAYGYGRPYYRGYARPYYYAPPVYYAPPPVYVEPAYGYGYGGYGGVAYAPAYAYGGYGRYPAAYRCRTSGGGAVIGAIAGGLIGNAVSHRYDRGFGTVAGAGIGAVAGNAVERNC